MSSSCNNCADVSLALEIGEDIRLQYNDLVAAYERLREYEQLQERALAFYTELYHNAREAILSEARQFGTMPAPLALPLIEAHGLKLGLARLNETEAAIHERHEKLADDLRAFAPSKDDKKILPFPARR